MSEVVSGKISLIASEYNDYSMTEVGGKIYD